jgi:hypothetical protein
MKEWLDNIPDLDNLFTLKSHEELEKIVNDWLSGDSENTDEFEAAVTRGGKPADSSVPALRSVSESSDADTSSSSKKYKSLDEAFADLEDL